MSLTASDIAYLKQDRWLSERWEKTRWKAAFDFFQLLQLLELIRYRGASRQVLVIDTDESPLTELKLM
jgi:hypothetical protein